MYKQTILKPIFLAFLVGCSTNICRAQNVQNFVNNEENKIQQESAAGVLNSQQSSALQNRQAQIMYQEQQDKNLNGGNLTQQEQRQIAGEERGIARGVNGAAYQNNPNSAALMNSNNWQNRQYSGWNQNNNNYQSGQSWRNLFNQNQNNVNNPAAQFNQPNGFNGQQQHHHRWQQWGNN